MLVVEPENQEDQTDFGVIYILFKSNILFLKANFYNQKNMLFFQPKSTNFEALVFSSASFQALWKVHPSQRPSVFTWRTVERLCATKKSSGFCGFNLFQYVFQYFLKSYLGWVQYVLTLMFQSVFHISQNITGLGSCFLGCKPRRKRRPSSAVRRDPPRLPLISSHLPPFFIHYSSHHTQLISHNNSSLTQLISRNSSHTQLISHNSSHTTHLTHNSSHTTHLTQLISHTTHLTQLISHNSSHTTHLTQLISHTTHLTQ